MLRIILADDEKPIREGLLEYIEWKRYGVEVIGCACDGQDALDQIAEKKPDLVFLDIQMPAMNGLDVIQAIQRLDARTPYFVILSGYDDFSFAKKAMSLGVDEYLLKPFRPQDIYAALYKSLLHIKPLSQSFLAQEQFTSVLSTVDPLCLPQTDYPFELERELLSALACRNYDACSRIYQFLVNIMQSGVQDESAVLYCSLVLGQTLLTLIENTDCQPSPALSKLEVSSAAPELILQEVLPSLLFTAYSALHANGNGHPTVEKIKSHIDSHYADPLTLEGLADFADISPSYLSGLFTAYEGVGLIRYIQNVRIRHAMDLLLTTTLHVNQIAPIVGYEDEKYFSRVFKKVTGMTTNQFKRSGR